MTNLKNVMSDYDLEVRRLIDGLETTRNPNPKSRLNAEPRTEYKTKYLNVYCGHVNKQGISSNNNA